MKNSILSLVSITIMLISCNQKLRDTTTINSEKMKNDTTMTTENSSKKMMTEKLYSCPMHPEVQGKLNDKCPKCGMKLTEPVSVN
jgi:Heavy metal binding domain